MFKLISKDQYLQLRDSWRHEYADMSLNIHVLKKAQKAAARGGYSAAAALMSLRARMSNAAHDMMDELEVLKENSRLSVQFERFNETRNS